MDFLSLVLITSFIVIIVGQEAPKVAPFSSHVKPVIGGKTSFTCQSLSGTSPIQISWFKNGLEITDSSDIRIRNIDDSSVLIINSIKSSHSGNYSCKVSNRFGYDSYSTELLVEGPPSWLEKPNKQIGIKFGDPFTLKCDASAYPQPKTQWKKFYDGSSWKMINKSNSNNYNQTKLIITNASRNDRGKYGCLVSNGIKPDLWTEFEVDVEDDNNFSVQ